MGKRIYTIVLFGLMFGLVYMTGPTETATAAEKAVVGVNALNVRAGPSQNDQVVERVQSGEAFTVLEEKYGWLKISLGGSKSGWIAGQFASKKAAKNTGRDKNTSGSSTNNNGKPTVTLSQDGTNLRSGPGVNYNVVARGNKNDRYPLLDQQGDWMQIKLPDGHKAFVAGWLAKSSKQTKQEASEGLSGKTIVIDPGHGGKDSGARGNHEGVLEKDLTLKTAKTLTGKLQDAGAHVVLTRNRDPFISLGDRVQIAEKVQADAFISLHYNASLDASAAGIASYYYKRQKDRPLAGAIQKGLSTKTDRRDRGTHYADYHVLRENSQPATLLELGFLSNAAEEDVVQTSSYKANVSAGIVSGLENYFTKNP